MLLYQKYPEFVDDDPRKLRTTFYTVTPEFQQTKHDIFFQNIDFTGKTVLDIGCCVGYTGAYALDKKAKFYQGVEISRELCNIAIRNFSKYFPVERWNISNHSIEDFLKDNKLSFDVVIVMGVIYAVKEPCSIIENLLKISQTILIDHAHPPINEFNPDENFLRNVSYVYYDIQVINYNDTTQNAEFYSAKAGMGLIKMLFDLNGFVYDLKENDQMQQTFPEQYATQIRHKYVIVGRKTNNRSTAIGYSSSLRSGDFKLSPF